MGVKPNKKSVLGVLFLLLGGASYVAELVFYDAVDEAGVLQESFFLPLSFILVFLGLALIFVGAAMRIISRISARR